MRGAIARGRVEHGRSGKVVEAEVQAGAGLEQLPDLVVGLVAAKGGVDFDQYNLRHAQIEGAPDFPGDHLRDEGENSLPRAAKLDHVEPQIVGLDDGGQRAALP